MKEKVVEKHAGVIRSSRWEDGMGDFVVTQMVSQQGGLTFVFRPLLADVLTTSARAACVQSDQAACSKPPFDIETKVVF